MPFDANLFCMFLRITAYPSSQRLIITDCVFNVLQGVVYYTRFYNVLLSATCSIYKKGAVLATSRSENPQGSRLRLVLDVILT